MAVDKSILDIKVENANWMELNNQLYKSLTRHYFTPLLHTFVLYVQLCLRLNKPLNRWTIY